MMKRIDIPNDVNSFVIDELRDRLSQGLDVTMSFGGTSMLPLIDGDSDSIVLRRVAASDSLRRGEVYMFAYQGHCVVHRLMRQRGDNLVFRGDNCVNVEHVKRDNVIARVVAVVKGRGTRFGRMQGTCELREDTAWTVSCDDAEWRKRSRRISMSRTMKNAVIKCFNRRQRRWQRWVYWVALLLLMWAPVGVIGVPLNNFVLGIRLDHLLHASVYIPAVLFLMDFWKVRKPSVGIWLVAVLVGIITETVQYFLPYRGFDINDMVANFMGVTLGFLIVRALKKKATKNNF